MPVQLEMVLRLIVAAALGAAIGYQREKVQKPAGLRTHVLISLGAALFTTIGIFGFASGDPSRVAAGIVSGIGFLGAGAILHQQGGIVVGLTTAASIWTAAAIGMAAGVGQLLMALAATVIVLIVLILPHHVG
jgi:putative Mg2+ transporter-C (MgtC) family protein